MFAKGGRNVRGDIVDETKETKGQRSPGVRKDTLIALHVVGLAHSRVAKSTIQKCA